VFTTSDWGVCDPETSKQTRYYEITTQAQNNGEKCPTGKPNPSEKACIPIEKNVNCKGEWGEWSNCEDGKLTRMYTVTTPASGNGTCPNEDGDTEEKECSKPFYKNPFIIGGFIVAILVIAFFIFSMSRNKVPV
jgi:hypothetical protein